MRFILFIILLFVVFVLWKKTMSKFSEAKKNFIDGTVPSGNKASELVQDPVCKLYISKESAIFHRGHYFCSEKCKNDFK